MNIALCLLTAAWALLALYRHAGFEWEILGAMSGLYALMAAVSGYRLSAALQSRSVELCKKPGA